MTEEMQDQDRFVMEIEGDTVKVIDTEAGVQARRVGRYTGPDRLINATRHLEQLNARPPVPSLADGGVPTWTDSTPAAFLAELPAFARQQRLNAMLAEVTRIEAQYVSLLAEDARLLKRASGLRQRLQDALTRPLSATLPDEESPVVPEEGPKFSSLQRAAQGLVRLEEDGKWYVPPLAGPKPLPY